MYCPNCGSQNKKKQNYCRYCGLYLQQIERSYLNQLVFGEESRQLKNSRTVKKFFEYAQILFFVSIIAGIILWIFSDPVAGKRLTSLSVGGFFLLRMLGETVAYFKRQSRRLSDRREGLTEAEQTEFEARATNKLIEEKEFTPASVAVEDSTKLLFADGKTGKSE